MKPALGLFVAAATLTTAVMAGGPQAAAPQGRPVPASAAAQYRAVLDRYGVSCHNERLQTGDLRLDTVDFDNVSAHAAAGRLCQITFSDGEKAEILVFDLRPLEVPQR